MTVVFGWYRKAFAAPESSQTYSLMVGFKKGGEKLQENLDFDIVPLLDLDPTSMCVCVLMSMLAFVYAWTCVCVCVCVCVVN